MKLSQLSGEEWIAWPGGSICHDFLLHTLRKAGHEPRIAHTAGEYATQLALVAAGLGACVLPRLGRGADPAGRDAWCHRSRRCGATFTPRGARTRRANGDSAPPSKNFRLPGKNWPPRFREAPELGTRTRNRSSARS